MSFGMFNMSSLFNTLIQEDERIRKEKLAALPYQLTPAKLNEKYKKKFNIGDKDVYYNITKNGEKICDGLFHNYMSDCTEKINKNRFVILFSCVEDEYSQSVVEYCNLKSKYCLSNIMCVFDMQNCEIAYLCNEKYDSSLTLYKNVCIDHRKNRVIWLPTKKVLIEHKDSLKNSKIGDYLFVSDCLYSEGTFMKRINIENGEVLDVDKI